MVVQVGLVWFGQNSEAEFNTVTESVSESVSDQGGYRAARAAKKYKQICILTLELYIKVYNMNFIFQRNFCNLVNAILHQEYILEKKKKRNPIHY